MAFQISVFLYYFVDCISIARLWFLVITRAYVTFYVNCACWNAGLLLLLLLLLWSWVNVAYERPQDHNEFDETTKLSFKVNKTLSKRHLYSSKAVAHLSFVSKCLPTPRGTLSRRNAGRSVTGRRLAVRRKWTGGHVTSGARQRVAALGGWRHRLSSSRRLCPHSTAAADAADAAAAAAAAAAPAWRQLTRRVAICCWHTYKSESN